MITKIIIPPAFMIKLVVEDSDGRGTLVLVRVPHQRLLSGW